MIAIYDCPYQNYGAYNFRCLKNGAFIFPNLTIQSEPQRTSVHIIIYTVYPMAHNFSYFIRYTCITSHAVACSWDGYSLCREAESITWNNVMKYGKEIGTWVWVGEEELGFARIFRNFMNENKSKITGWSLSLFIKEVTHVISQTMIYLAQTTITSTLVDAWIKYLRRAILNLVSACL